MKAYIDPDLEIMSIDGVNIPNSSPGTGDNDLGWA